MRNFRNLEVWKRSRILVRDIYILTAEFPSTEKFGITSQLRRAAVSVPSNISEGCGRGTIPQLQHFLDISIGSLCELETQMLLCCDLKLLQGENIKVKASLDEISQLRRMIIGYQKSLPKGGS